MTAKDLKNALLQEAVQGKLVPQIASEGNARDLLEEIRKEKAKLVKEGKLKKEKPMPEITEEDIPFDIPENWCWCRITDIATCELGKTKDAIKNKGELKDYLCSINIQENGIDLSKVKQMKFENDEIERYSVKKNDLLICEGGDAGRCAIYDLDTPMFYQNALHRVRFYNGINQVFYLYLFQLYKANNILMEASKGVTIQHLTGESLRNLCFPLPPLAEQKRIVAAIEKFMPLIEEYGKKETELKTFNEQIGILTKKAILQEAVQGKLVPQIAAEGNAKDLLEEIKKGKAKLIKEGKIKKEKPLPEITEDEIPFDIPENWCWCRLGEIVNKLTDGTHRTPKYVEKGIPFLSVKNLSSGKMDFENTKFITPEEHKELYARCNPEKGDMLLTKVGTTGIPVINDSDIEFSLFVSVALIKFNHNLLDEKFFLYLLQSPLVQDQAKENTRGVGNKNWVMDAIANTMLVLPPLAEQKRIVSAIEKLLSLCEKFGE